MVDKEEYNFRLLNHLCTRCASPAIEDERMCKYCRNKTRNTRKIYTQNNRDKINENNRKYMIEWSKKNPEEKARRNKKWRAKWSGIPEFSFREKLLLEFPKIISLDDNRPDFYDSKNKYFIEIKRALPFRRCMWIHESPEFPDIFFAKRAKGVCTPTIDEQIARYPKPLLVIIVHALTGEELIRKIYKENKHG